MCIRALLIVTLLVIVIAAPVVDVIACNDCNDIILLRAAQGLARVADLSDGTPLSSASQENGSAQDLCPVCANIATAMDTACCGAPSLVSESNHLPELIAVSDPSYSINKPPQN